MLLNTNLNHTSKILLAAADLIRENGLCRGRRFDGKSYCMHGAVDKVLGGQMPEAEERVMTHVGKYLDSKGINYRGIFGFSLAWDISYWNNKPERTAQQVIDVLEGAALYEG